MTQVSVRSQVVTSAAASSALEDGFFSTLTDSPVLVTEDRRDEIGVEFVASRLT